MPAKKSADKYPNVIKKQVTMTVADTAAFEEIEVGLNLFDKVGLLIHRISYYIDDDAVSQLTTDADSLAVGIVGSNQISTLNADERSVLDVFAVDVSDNGTPGNFVLYMQPVVHDFSTFPGGGLLVPPKPLYVGMDTAGFSTAYSATAVIHFTVVSLADADYLELIETFRFFD